MGIGMIQFYSKTKGRGSLPGQVHLALLEPAYAVAETADC